MDLIEEKVRQIEGILIQLQNEIVKVFKALGDNGQTHDLEEKSKSIEEFLNRVLVKIVDGHFNDTPDGHDDDGENSQIFESDELHDFDDPGGDSVDDGPDLDQKCPIKIEGFNYQNNIISPTVLIERLPAESLMTNNNLRKTRSMSKPEPKLNDKIEKLQDNHRNNAITLLSSSNKTADLLVECRKRKLVIVLEKLHNYSDSDGVIKENSIGKRRKIQLKDENEELSQVEGQNLPYDNDADYQNESSNDEDYEKPDKNKKLVCTKCKKRRYFNNESGLKYHNQRFHSTFKFTCKIDKCKQIFNSHKSYQEHRNVNHTFCKLCSKKFDSRYLYLNHLVTQHEDENLWFSCLNCPKKYLKLKNLRNHTYNIHKVKKFCYQDYKRRKFEIEKPSIENDNTRDLNCDFEGCFRQFSLDKKHLFDFHRFTHGIKDFELFREQKICPICHKQFEFKKKNDRGFRHHIMGHHPDSSLKPRLQCQYCEKSFKLRRSLVDHEKTHLNCKFPCPECSMSFNMRKTLNLHKQNRHGAYLCTYEGCTKGFNTLQSLELHSKHHNQVYICHMCSTVPFKSNDHLNRHISRCHVEYPCEYEGCSQIFTKIYNLRKHEAAEHDSGKVPEFLCTTCGKALWTKLQLYLQEVLRNSTGPKFQCEYCDRIYTQAQSLKYHVKNTHLNKREFVCTHEGCGKSFTNERALVIHADSHLGQVSRYPCKFCDKSLTTKNELVVHTNKYHKKERDYPFKCSERDCGESFYRNKFLQDHIQKVHSKDL